MVAFGRLCESAGLRGPDVDHRGDLRDVLLDLFKSTAIRERVTEALAPLFENRATRRILTMTMLIATHQGSISASFVRNVVGEDPFMALKPLADLSYEIFEASADGFRARSSIFSSFVIAEFIEAEEIADVVVEVTLAAAQRRVERPYRILMSKMIAYSSLRRILCGKGNPDAVIANIYERLRYDERVNGEPLFWLQYAIAMVEKSRLDAANEFIATAYRKAEELSGFQTYQIDTQAFRIALMSAMEHRAGQTISNLDAILSGFERINAMLGDESHRSYAVKVLEHVQPFVMARIDDLANGERTSVQFWLLKVEKSLSLLPDEFKSASGSEGVRKSVETAAKMFISSNVDLYVRSMSLGFLIALRRMPFFVPVAMLMTSLLEWIGHA
ncbi:hypothetical protein [Zymomonas mobilis]|nr:hypothetical protein [Zymomonas mobilis]